MTVLKYLTESKVATTGEILAFKRDDPKGFDGLLEMARREMTANGITIDAPVTK